MKYKHIGSATRSLVDSFTSLMNGVDGEYTMDALAQRAMAAESPELTIDWMTGAAAPAAFLSSDLQSLIDAYVRDYPRFLSRQRASIDAIRSSVTTLRFHLDQLRETPSPAGLVLTVAYTCRSVVMDDRGREHVVEFSSETSTFRG